MASPQVENGYTRVANELLEALCRARLGGREMRVVLAVIRLTYGYGEKEARISLGMLERVTGIRKDALMKALTTLERKKILSKRKEKNRLVLSIQKNYERWSFYGPTKRQPTKRQLQGTQKDNPKGHKKTTPDPLQSLEVQALPGPLKKTIKENLLKKTSSYRDDDLKEVISRWEEVFGEAFPVERTQESVRAADYMLYLYERGRLPAVKRPSAYLRKLAASELEPFPGLSERRRQAEEAERRMRELDRRELARFYARTLSAGYQIEVPEEVRPLVEEILSARRKEEGLVARTQ